MITADDLKSLRHMLGVSEHVAQSKWGYRNYFAAGRGQIERMERLVDAGFAERGGKSGEMTYYHATEAGMDAVGMSAAAKRRAMQP